MDYGITAQNGYKKRRKNVDNIQLPCYDEYEENVREVVPMACDTKTQKVYDTDRRN